MTETPDRPDRPDDEPAPAPDVEPDPLGMPPIEAPVEPPPAPDDRDEPA